MSNCPGICPTLKSCDACTVQGQGMTTHNYTSAKELRYVNKCSWCVKEGTCQKQEGDETTSKSQIIWSPDVGMVIKESNNMEKLFSVSFNCQFCCKMWFSSLYVSFFFVCHSAPKGVCYSSRNTMSGLEGWWGGLSASITLHDDCPRLDLPAGIHWIRYKSPVNFDMPDEVSRCMFFL